MCEAARNRRESAAKPAKAPRKRCEKVTYPCHVLVARWVLRLQDVVVGSSEGEDDGSSDAEVRHRGERDDGQSTFSDGSLYTRGGSEWTREAECDGAEEGRQD